tara:strand:- start:3268 stop:3948 length:681 start_codon:yes stop_codon:yes gene_type:complete
MAKFAKIIHQNNENLLIKKFIRLFSKKLRNNTRERFSLVLAGGKSPIKLYKSLSKNKKIPWKKIDFFIGDERLVEEKSNNSNIGMCKKHLLNKIKISNKQIFKISTNKLFVKDSVLDYEKKIKKYFFKKKVSFDLTLLGIGIDGHIASLFRKDLNKKNNKNVVYIKRKDFKRISLTLKCLNNSKSIFLWAPGKFKSSIIKKILSDNKYKYPVSFLKEKNNFLFHSN